MTFRGFAALSVILAVVLAARAQSHIAETVTQTLYVDVQHARASDVNPGTSVSAPLRTIQAAIDKAGSSATKIVVNPGTYREYVKIGRGSNLIILESAKAHEAVLSGSERYEGWAADASGAYAHAWRFAWKMGTENGWWGSTAYNRRREMVYVNGVRMEQVCDGAGNPVPASSLVAGQFTVTDAGGNGMGSILLKPPAGVDMTRAQVEVAERGRDSTYLNESRPLLEITSHSNIVLRGFTVTHCANYIKFGAAVSFFGEYPGSFDKLPANVLIDDCRIVENNGIGMEITNYRDVTVRNSWFNLNGERGAGSVQNGTEVEKTKGVLVNPRRFLYQDCQFNQNNWRMKGTWGDMNDAAGYKMFGQNIDSYTFLRCQFSRNLANGFWQDYGGSNITLDHCIAEENVGDAAGGYGVLSEMTRGPLTLKGCVIRNNGNSGFISSGAPNVTIRDCFLYPESVSSVWVSVGFLG